MTMKSANSIVDQKVEKEFYVNDKYPSPFSQHLNGMQKRRFIYISRFGKPVEHTG